MWWRHARCACPRVVDARVARVVSAFQCGSALALRGGVACSAVAR